MPRSRANKTYLTFAGGLNTEASPLTFPENTAKDAINFTLNKNGSASRRKGIDAPSSGAYTFGDTSSASSPVYTTYRWKSVNNKASIEILAVQYGEVLSFFDATKDEPFQYPIGLTILLTDIKSDSSFTADQIGSFPLSYASGRGYLVIASKYIYTLVLYYDETSSPKAVKVKYSIGMANSTGSNRILYMRDIIGAEDGLQPGERPNTLSSEHAYNLLNQGWKETDIDTFQSASGVYPSNSDIWSIGKYTDPSTGRDTWSWSQYNEQQLGTLKAPKGKFITNVFDTTQSFSLDSAVGISSWSYDHALGEVTVTTVADHGKSVTDSIEIKDNSFEYDNGSGCGSSVTGTLDGTYTITAVPSTTSFKFSHTITGWVAFCNQYVNKGRVVIGTVTNPSGKTEIYRPSVVEFYNSRLFYSGIESSHLGSYILFSQIVDNDEQLDDCYQANDPTSEHYSDLLDTDGGVLVVPELGEVKDLKVSGAYLYIFTSNGTWRVGPGGSTGFFSPTDYTIERVTAVPTASRQGVTIAESVPVFLSYNGIYIIASDPNNGTLSTQSITETTVKSDIIAIPDNCKESALLYYDDLNNRVVLLYSSDTNNPTIYDKALFYDLNLKAFYKWNLPKINNGSYVGHIVSVVDLKEYLDVYKKLRFLAWVDGSCQLVYENNSKFYDFEYVKTNFPKQEANGYIWTGYELAQEVMRNKQIDTIVTHMKLEGTQFVDDGSGNAVLDQEGGCLLSTRWNWSTSSSYNKWTTPKEIYRLDKVYSGGAIGDPFDYGREVISFKDRMNGEGISISLYFETETEKACTLYGWGILLSGNGLP